MCSAISNVRGFSFNDWTLLIERLIIDDQKIFYYNSISFPSHCLYDAESPHSFPPVPGFPAWTFGAAVIVVIDVWLSFMCDA